MQKICPVTSLETYRNRDYIDIEVGENYKTTFVMIGKSILYMKTNGDTATANVNHLIEKRNDFLDEFFIKNGQNPKEQKVVEIRDLSNTYGRPDHYNKNVQTEFILSGDNRLLSLVMIGVPKVTEVIYKVGLKFINPPIPIKMVKNYEKALAYSFNLVQNKENHSGTSYENDQKWRYGGKRFVFIIEIMDPNILLFRAKGVLSKSYLKGMKNVIWQAFEQGQFDKNNYYRIVDYSEVTGSTLKGRTGYLKLLKEVFNRYNSYPLQTYVCGANTFIQTTIKLYSKMAGFNVILKNSVEEAIKATRTNHPENQETPGQFLVSRDDVNSLISYIGNISWEMQHLGLEEKGTTSFNNPLDEVCNAIDVLGGDVKSLIHNEKKIKQEIQHQNNLLREAKEEAQEANIAKSMFLDTMSHELRTPMNGMMGFISLLSDTKLNDEQKEYVDYLQKSSQALLEKIKDILDFTSMDGHDKPIKMEYIAIREFLSQLRNKTEKQMKKNLSVIVKIDKKIPDYLKINDKYLDKIFNILILNAIKFTDRGYVKIIAKFVEIDSDADSVIVEFGVEDSGIGVPKNKHKEIFNTFTQVDSKISRIYDGTGLGLAIFKKMVEKMDGVIDLQSKKGEGSLFSFTLAMNYK